MALAILDTIRESWGWLGLDPAEVIDKSAFGNLIVRATDGVFWRICPEELTCEMVARNAAEFAELSNKDEFRADWEMSRLVDMVEQRLGPPGEERCYCLKLPAAIGGTYEIANVGIISLVELLSFSGEFAKQIKDLPDHSQIEISLE